MDALELFAVDQDQRNKNNGVGGPAWNEGHAAETASSSEGSASTSHQTPKKLRRHKTGILSPSANHQERYVKYIYNLS